MKTFREAEIKDILPEWMGEETEVQCLSYALNMELRRMLDSADSTAVFADIDNASSYILNALAMEMQAPYYDDSLPLETRRELIKKTSPWYSRAGTVSAVEDMVATIFGEGKVTEWFEYSGNPGCFKIIASASLTPDLFDAVKAMIEKVKNARSLLEEITVGRKINQRIYTGVVRRYYEKNVIIEGYTDTNVHRQTVNTGTAERRWHRNTIH